MTSTEHESEQPTQAPDEAVKGQRVFPLCEICAAASLAVRAVVARRDTVPVNTGDSDFVPGWATVRPGRAHFYCEGHRHGR